MKSLLFRYAGFPLTPRMARWTGHGGKWAWWCIYDILKEMGLDITLHNWNEDIPPGRLYDVIVSIQHLAGIEHVTKPDTIKILRLTTADPHYHNNAIIERVETTNARRGAELQVRRTIPIDGRLYDSIDEADHVFLNGNDFIRRTYPEKYWDKIIPVDNAAGNINERVSMRDFVPKKRAFLWHAGSGALHKGLDLCLEVFAKHPEWELYVTGNLRGEPDFLREYRVEFGLLNIHYFGWMIVSSPQFKALVNECFAFINPTCAEGQSPAVATCLTLGLYPIISRFTGIDLPEGCGLFLESLTIGAVEQAVKQVYYMDDAELLEQVRVIQGEAITKYSRETFRKVMTKLLNECL